MYEIRYFGSIPTMIYVRMWNHTLNNVQFLVSNMSKEHERLIIYINKFHPYGESHRLLPKFYTRTYECIANAIVSSLAAGRPINAWPDTFLQYLIAVLMVRIYSTLVLNSLWVYHSNCIFNLLSIPTENILVNQTDFFLWFSVECLVFNYFEKNHIYKLLSL